MDRTDRDPRAARELHARSAEPLPALAAHQLHARAAYQLPVRSAHPLPVQAAQQVPVQAAQQVPVQAAQQLHTRVALAVALVTLAATCGGGGCEGGGEARGSELRVRLPECAGTLHVPPRPAAVELLHEGFAGPPAGWRELTSQTDVLTVEPGVLRQAAGHEEQCDYLTLSGSKGAVYRTLPIEPDTLYSFVGRLRARAVTPRRSTSGEPDPPASGDGEGASRSFAGATFWVGEHFRAGTPDELFAGGGNVDRHHPLPSVAGREGWRELRLVFRSAPEARALTVGCLLSIAPLASGEVDFDELRLTRASAAELWEFEAERAVAEAQSGALPADWRARRSLRAMVGGEERPSVLLLPGERLELEVAVPRARPVLATGLAPWPGDELRSGGEVTLWVRAEGRELVRETLPLAGERAERRWREVRCALDGWAGRRVRLELGVEGDHPGLFGGAVVQASGAPGGGSNVVLISIDTLRPDRLGAYGARSGASPRLDELARASLVFEDVTAQAPYTLPSHATLFTGQFPRVHGVQGQGSRLSARRSPILARILAERGYTTQAFAAGVFLAPVFGFAQGFDGFSIVDPFRHPGSTYFEDLARANPGQVSAAPDRRPGSERVRAWLAEHQGEPFFLFLHTYEVHDYDPPPGALACRAGGCRSTLTDFRPLNFKARAPVSFPGTEEDRAHLGHLYDAALRHVDEQVGALLDDLARLGLSERTIVVVTSDHGEELFERGHLQHGKTVYEEVTRVPLIVRIPGVPARRSATPALSADVLPTLLEQLSIPIDPRVQGRDLLGASPPRPVWCEVDDLFVRKAALRDGRWKLIHGPPDPELTLPNEREWELYDLERDPGERSDRSAEEAGELARLQELLRAFAEHLERESQALGPIESGDELDEAILEQLRELGYG